MRPWRFYSFFLDRVSATTRFNQTFLLCFCGPNTRASIENSSGHRPPNQPPTSASTSRVRHHQPEAVLIGTPKREPSTQMRMSHINAISQRAPDVKPLIGQSPGADNRGSHASRCASARHIRPPGSNWTVRFRNSEISAPPIACRPHHAAHTSHGFIRRLKNHAHRPESVAHIACSAHELSRAGSATTVGNSPHAGPQNNFAITGSGFTHETSQNLFCWPGQRLLSWSWASSISAPMKRRAPCGKQGPQKNGERA